METWRCSICITLQVINIIMWPIWPCSNNPTGNHNHRTWHLKVQVDWYELIRKTVVFHICTTLLHFPRMWFLLLDLNLKKKKKWDKQKWESKQVLCCNYFHSSHWTQRWWRIPGCIWNARFFTIPHHPPIIFISKSYCIWWSG